MAHIEEMWAEGTVEQELFDGIYTDTNEVGDVFPWGAKFVYPSSFQAQPLHFVPCFTNAYDFSNKVCFYKDLIQ